MLHGEQVSPRQRLMQSPEKEKEGERQREASFQPKVILHRE